MRLMILALLSLLLPAAAWAYTPDVSDLSAVPRVQLDASTLKAAVAQAKGQPLKFAVGSALSATTATGAWDEPESGIARWRLRIASSGAKSLSLQLEDLRLPADAALYFYTAGGDDVQGPYRATDGSRLVTPIARSDEAVLEVRMPSGEKSAFGLRVARAFHAYRELSAKSFASTNGTSGACEKDVACSTGDNYRDQIRSTVLLTIVSGGDTYLCSGSLINNAARDDRALVLTAHHCEITAANVTQSIAYFNVERANCNGLLYGSVTQNIHGKTLLADAGGSTVTDYSLFELNSVPPTSYDVYYAGWEVSGTAPTSGAVIHHPSGDDKKISLYTQAATAQSNICIGTASNCSDGFRVDSWEVYWATGTTEGGSSGSGLLNQNKRIVGTLSGGAGACSGTANNGDPDYFARLDRAWTATSTTGTTLKTVLAASSGCTSLDGKNPGTASAIDCNGTTTGGSTTGGTTGSDSGGGGGGGALGLLLTPLAFAALWRRRPR
ncbi:trypsin-like serine peptidase [Solimonas flava]|uniref:trypsin-like serine peptidase n=1 Tax=Solimonas flava TaxID=415849 RepID=UPI0003FE4A16|nr:trypsin-like peptidase domain-containing protein [Solimonas flava]